MKKSLPVNPRLSIFVYMKPILATTILFLLISCGNTEDVSYRKAEDAQDAAREFIRASLDGDYHKARYYMLSDSSHQNQYLLERWKKNYDQLPESEKQMFKDASIVVLNTHAENDSTSLFTYFNSYKKDTTTIKIVRLNGNWEVDLKEISNHHP